PALAAPSPDNGPASGSEPAHAPTTTVVSTPAANARPSDPNRCQRETMTGIQAMLVSPGRSSETDGRSGQAACRRADRAGGSTQGTRAARDAPAVREHVQPRLPAGLGPARDALEGPSVAAPEA